MAKKTTGKTTTKAPMSREVNKANRLRLSTNRTGRQMKSIVAKWTEESRRTMSFDERVMVDKKFKEQLEAAERVWGKKYDRYYNYVHTEFSKKEISSSYSSGNFMDKSFIDNLQRLRERSKTTKKGGKK